MVKSIILFPFLCELLMRKIKYNSEMYALFNSVTISTDG